jgi:hypothetical protein
MRVCVCVCVARLEVFLRVFVLSGAGGVCVSLVRAPLGEE